MKLRNQITNNMENPILDKIAAYSTETNVRLEELNQKLLEINDALKSLNNTLEDINQKCNGDK